MDVESKDQSTEEKMGIPSVAGTARAKPKWGPQGGGQNKMKDEECTQKMEGLASGKVSTPNS